MSEQLENRSYNNFSEKSIYNNLRKPTGHDYGWVDEYFSDDNSTPINADNLNAMLNMLIYIRNVIGKTDDFELTINDQELSASLDSESNNNTIAKYIKSVADAIIGSENDLSNTSITRTLAGLKNYLEGLDVSNENNTEEINNSADNKWVNKITQIDGKINVEYSQPDAQYIKYTKDSEGTNLDSDKTVDDALDKLDTTIGNLDTIKFDSETEISTIDNLIAIIQKVINDRIERDNELLGTDINDKVSTIKKNAALIDATTEALNTYANEHAEDYTNTEINELIANQKIDIKENGGIIDNNGIQLDPIYLSYLKKMTFATPSIKTFTITPAASTLEVGNTYTLSSIKHSEANKDSILGSLTLKRGSTVLKSDIAPTESDTSIPISDSVTLNSNGSETYSLSGTYIDSEGKNQSITSSKSITWYWPHFYGALSAESFSQALLSALKKSTSTSSNFSGTISITNNTDEYVYFVTKDSSLTVKSGGFDVPLTQTTQALTINGISTNYYIYRTNQLNAGTLTYVLS